ncbi:MAG: aldo/keto reductase [Elainellaceae cyanobacterium]
MNLPASSYVQFTPDLKICRLLNGMWQVSGNHGRIPTSRAIASMFDYVEAGFTTWDLADHYGPAEDFVGEFRKKLADRHSPAALTIIQALTKWVPRPGVMTREIVETNVNTARLRMGGDPIDLMQLHWWDYRDRHYIDALKHLVDLKTEGAIRHLGLTNFDTDHLTLILDHGIPIVSNQVQFSLIDRRPLVKLAQRCQECEVHLLAYGTLCGGLISEKYLGQSEPNTWDLNTASLRKYKNMVDAWGGWPLFQDLLKNLKAIATKHEVSIANVAVRYVLEQPAVAGAIVGARLGVSQHIDQNSKVFGFELDADDYDQLEVVLGRSHDLFEQLGDCGEEYRHR